MAPFPAARQIGLLQTALGTEVTIQTRPIPDLENVTVTLLVAAIVLDWREQAFRTVGIETTQHLTVSSASSRADARFRRRPGVRGLQLAGTASRLDFMGGRG